MFAPPSPSDSDALPYALARAGDQRDSAIKGAHQRSTGGSRDLSGPAFHLGYNVTTNGRSGTAEGSFHMHEFREMR